LALFQFVRRGGLGRPVFFNTDRSASFSSRASSPKRKRLEKPLINGGRLIKDGKTKCDGDHTPKIKLDFPLHTKVMVPPNFSSKKGIDSFANSLYFGPVNSGKTSLNGAMGCAEWRNVGEIKEGFGVCGIPSNSKLAIG
jgi:hypothetical protein